jgi:hypothetical protein
MSSDVATGRAFAKGFEWCRRTVLDWLRDQLGLAQLTAAIFFTFSAVCVIKTRRTTTI